MFAKFENENVNYINQVPKIMKKVPNILQNCRILLSKYVLGVDFILFGVIIKYKT